MTEELEGIEVEQPVAAGTSAGRMLAEARNRLGLSVAEVARQLRLSTSQIDALETDDHARLPGKTFLRGFVRNYAKLLQIDPEPLLAYCNPDAPQALPIAMPMSSIEFGNKRRLMPFGDRPDRNWMKYAMAAGVLVLVVALFWGVYVLIQGRTSAPDDVVKSADDFSIALSLPPIEMPVPVEPTVNQAGEIALPLDPAANPAVTVATASVETAAQAPVSVPVPEAGGQRLQFVFEGDAWVEVKDKSAKVISYQLNPKGIPLTVRGNPPFYLVIGNATRVKLTYNDKPVDLVPYIKVDVARLTIE